MTFNPFLSEKFLSLYLSSVSLSPIFFHQGPLPVWEFGTWRQVSLLYVRSNDQAYNEKPDRIGG